MSTLLTHAGLLPFLLDFLLLGMCQSWTWKKWCQNVNQRSWAPFPSNAAAHGEPLNCSLKKWKLAPLKPSVTILLVVGHGDGGVWGMCRCGTVGRGLEGNIDGRLDWMTSEVFPNLDDGMIPWFHHYSYQAAAAPVIISWFLQFPFPVVKSEQQEKVTAAEYCWDLTNTGHYFPRLYFPWQQKGFCCLKLPAVCWM